MVGRAAQRVDRAEHRTHTQAVSDVGDGSAEPVLVLPSPITSSRGRRCCCITAAAGTIKPSARARSMCDPFPR